MQFFWFFYTNTEGTSYGRKRTGGVYPTGTLRRGLVPTNIKNKNFIVLFPVATRYGLRQSFRPSGTLRESANTLAL